MSSSRAELSADTRRKILLAARIEFTKHGLLGARVDRIAAASKMNKQLIYRHFESKQGLYDAVLTELIQETRAQLDAARTEGVSYVQDYLRSPHVAPDNGMVWARMQGWEGLTDASGTIQRELSRRENFTEAIAWLAEDQRAGLVSDRFDPAQLFAFSTAATLFPFIVPHVFKLIFGKAEITSDDIAAWRVMISEILIHIE